MSLGNFNTISARSGANRGITSIFPTGANVAVVSVADGGLSTTSVVSKPSGGWNLGNWLIAYVQDEGTTLNATAPSGWTQIANVPSAALLYNMTVFVHQCTASEPASYTFTANVPQNCVADVIELSGVAGIDTIATNAATASTSAVFPSVTTNAPNEAIVLVFIAPSGATISSWPAGFTQEDFNTGHGIGSSFGLQVAAGATGTFTGTIPSSSYIAATIALKTAPVSIDNMTIGGTTPLAATVTSMNGGPLAGHRNMIMNGDFRIDQRNTGSSITPVPGTYVADRWGVGVPQASKFTSQVVTSTTPGSINALKLTSSGVYSPISTDDFYIYQGLEGFTISHLQWGTANAKSATFSGIINCSLTGALAVYFGNAAGTRSRAESISIPVANVDTPFSITFPGDTAGSWPTDNSGVLYIYFMFSLGSTRVGATGGWVGSASIFGPVGCINLLGTSGATLTIKDVQFEAGSVATQFERRSYIAELSYCGRYYQKFINNSVGPILVDAYNTTGAPIVQTFIYPSMRATPTGSFIGSWGSSNASGFNLQNEREFCVLYTNVVSTGDAYIQAPAFGGFQVSADL